MGMTASAKVELGRQYEEFVGRFWEAYTTLAQVVREDFPDPHDPAAVATRYHLDMMRDLTLRTEALVDGYERAT